MAGLLLASFTAGATLITSTVTSGAALAQSVVRAPAATAPYKIVLSNNFLGNDWRPETSACDPHRKTGAVQGQNPALHPEPGSTTSDQIASLNDIIESKPAAILVDASSAAALNPTLTRRACNAGILVVSFDNPVTDSCAYKVSQNMAQGMLVVGQWINYTLKGTGSIFVDRGLPASSAATSSELVPAGPQDRRHQDQGGQLLHRPVRPRPRATGHFSDLVGDKNVTGVMTQGYCKPAFTAFKDAGISALPARELLRLQR